MTFSHPLSPVQQQIVAWHTRAFMAQYLVDLFRRQEITDKSDILRYIQPKGIAGRNEEGVKRLHIMLERLSQREKDQLERLPERLFEKMKTEFDFKNKIWIRFHGRALVRPDIIFKAGQANSRDYSRLIDNLEARMLALVMYLLFDYSIYHAFDIIRGELKNLTAKYAGSSAGFDFKEINRRLFFHGLKNHHLFSEIVSDRQRKAYLRQILNHCSPAEKHFLKLVVNLSKPDNTDDLLSILSEG